MKLGDVISDLGRVVAYHPALNAVTGGVKATIFLEQLLYWRGLGDNPHGWVYKKQSELEEETGLGRREQESARAALVERGLLEERKKTAPPTVHYRVNVDRLEELWRERNPSKSARQIEMAESAILKCAKPTNQDGGKRQILNTEITTEITTERVSAAREAVAATPAKFTPGKPAPEPKVYLDEAWASSEDADRVRVWCRSKHAPLGDAWLEEQLEAFVRHFALIKPQRRTARGWYASAQQWLDRDARERPPVQAGKALALRGATPAPKPTGAQRSRAARRQVWDQVAATAR